MLKPSSLPPRPISMFLRPCAQKSSAQRICTRSGSMSRRFSPRSASHASSWLRSCCMRLFSATIARLFAFVIASMSPVSPSDSEVRGTTCARPPPAALPLMLNVGPPDGWRTQPTTFLPRRPRPSTRPSVVVVLPSPSAVGVIAVTSMYLPRFFSPRRRRTRVTSTFASTLPYGVHSSSCRPSSAASSFAGRRPASAASAISQSFIFVGSSFCIVVPFSA